MDRFDEILKEKIEQFEVPYNEAHWAEMDAKLNKIKAAKIKNTSLGIAAGVATLGVLGYMIFSSPKKINNSANSLTDNNTIVKEEILENNNTPIEISENTTEQSLSNETTNEVINSDNSHISVDENNNQTQSENNNSITESSTTEKLTDVKETNHNSSNHNTNTKQVTSDFIVYNNSVCVGEEVTFEAIETNAPVSYLWNFGDGKISHKTNPTHVYEHDGLYDVTLTLIDRQTGKEYTKIQREIVKILPQPDTYYTYLEESKKHDDNKLKYPYTNFEIKNPEKETTYKWDFGNGLHASGISTKTIYQKGESFTVTVIAENSYGCVITSQKKVTIKDGVNLYAPTAFTPNQDGTNETFIPKSLLEWDVTFEMIITNKSGKPIYKTSDKTEPWNGKLNNTGQLLDEGPYFWQVITTDAYAIQHSYQGTMQLLK